MTSRTRGKVVSKIKESFHSWETSELRTSLQILPRGDVIFIQTRSAISFNMSLSRCIISLGFDNLR